MLSAQMDCFRAPRRNAGAALLSHRTEKTRQRHGRPADFRPRPARGFTLIELMSVVGVVGLLTALAIPKAQGYTDRAKISRAIGDIRTIQIDIDAFAAHNDSLPTSLAEVGRAGLLDPWGRPYQYINFSLSPGNGVPNGARRDRFLVPINSTYDLFSVGKDGQSAPALTARSSKDDIVRGNDGGFIGRATLY